MKIEHYQPGDEQAISGLFYKVFGREMSEHWWNWRFKKNPIDDLKILLCWDEHKLVSHYAVSPCRLVVEDEPVLAALSMTTMTDPEYSGRGLFPKLAEELYTDLTRQGYSAVLGFPNSNSHATFIDKIGWRDIFAQHTLERPIKIETKAIPGFSHNTYPAPQAPDDYPHPEAGIAWQWEYNYFKWRLSPESGENYYITAIRDASANDVSAYAVWKLYGFDSLDIVHLTSRSRESTLALIAALDVKGQQAGVAKMVTWVPVSHKTHRLLERGGFVPNSPVTYFAGRSLQPNFVLPNSSQWYISMLCTDVY